MAVYKRNPLRERPQPMSGDVADAIEMIVAASDSTLPIPVEKGEIIEKLIEIAQTDEAGVYTAPSGPAGNAMMREFHARLTNTTVFQTGYKRYSTRASRAVVPVVDFFFRVLGGRDVCDALDGMNDFEITQSLPKRPSRQRDANGAVERDEAGEVLFSGEIAGIVVFPADSNHKLLDEWLKRRAAVAVGGVNSAVNTIGYAKPNDPRLIAAKNKASAFNPMLKQAALPPPDEDDDEDESGGSAAA